MQVMVTSSEDFSARTEYTAFSCLHFAAVLLAIVSHLVHRPYLCLKLIVCT